MAQKRPKQSPGCSTEDLSALARQIREELKRQHMTQKDLSARSGLAESRISRILRGGNVTINEKDIAGLALGLRKLPEERDKLRYLAFPWLCHVDESLRYGESVAELNCRLYEAGLPLMGNDHEE